MRFAVIGPLRVLSDDLGPLTVPGAKERLLLAALVAAAPGVVSVDRLLDTLWDGSPPPSARKSLQAHVVRLRSALEPQRPKGSTGQFVVRRGPGYALAVDRTAIDALAIGDLAARGRARLASGDAEDAVRQLRDALDLWRGEPYADWPDAAFADGERRRLTEVRTGALAGLLEAQVALGRHAEVVPELERLVAEEPLREGWWSLLMLALYRDGRQADALAAGRRARAVLAEELGADPGPGLRAREAAILAQDPALDLLAPRAATAGPTSPSHQPADGARLVASGTCPYKGLAAYQVADAPLFHGRARLVSSLVRRLVDSPLLVVSGPSGAGKSSVVRAGLLPALAADALPGSGAWPPVVLTPGRNPVDALADLTGDPPPDQPVLLVCDQFEQIWAPGVDAAERSAFLDTVLGLLDDGVVTRCVAVVRGDHLGRLATHAAFTDRLDGAVVLVPPLTDPELRDVVREPARSVGLSVQPELLDLVIADVLGQAGGLPFLSTALVGTWERRRDDSLTLAGYLEAGGVAGALTRSAEATYAALDEVGREWARPLLLRLADTDEGDALVRRSVPLDELDLHGDRGTMRRGVVEAFVARRLLAVDAGRLQVAHEALLSAWPRLVRWLEDDARGREVRRHLAPAALEWQRGDRPAEELYRGARLAAALDWAGDADAEVTPLEQQFLQASKDRSDAELRTAQDRADREAQRAEREARSKRRTFRLAAGLATVLVLALLATGLAVRYQRDAAARAVVADANRLAALSTTTGPLDVSLLLAAEAVRLADTPETEDGMLATLVEHRRAVQVASLGGRAAALALTGDGRRLYASIPGASSRLVTLPVRSTSTARPVVGSAPDDIDGSPTGDLVAAAYMNEGLRLEVRGPDGSAVLRLAGANLGWPLDVAFTGDGERLVMARGTEPTARGMSVAVRELDLRSRRWRTVAPVMRAGPSAFLWAELADDARSVVAWTVTKTPAATWVDLASGSRVRLRVARRDAASVEFMALPSGAAQLWDDGVVTLYDRRGRAAQSLEVHEEQVRDVLVAPTGTWAATAGDDATVVLWDVDPATGRWSRRETLRGHGGEIVGLELDPTGRVLFTAATDGRVIAWDVTGTAGFGTSYPGLGDRWIANRPQAVGHDDLLVAATRPVSASVGGGGLAGHAESDTAEVAATFFDASTGRVVDEVAVGRIGDAFLPLFGSSVAVSPDLRRVAVTSELTTTVLDTRTHAVLGKVVLPPAGDVDADGKPVPEAVWGAGWTRSGTRLLLGTEGSLEDDSDGGLVVVNPSGWRVERRIRLGGDVQTIQQSPDGTQLAVGRDAGPEIWLLDAATLEKVRTLRLSAGESPFDLAFSSDGASLAAGGDGGLLTVFDTATGRRLQPPVQVDNAFAQQVEWLPDGRTVVASGAGGAAALYDVRRGIVRALPLPASGRPGAGYTHLVPGPDRDLVVLGGERAGHRYPLNPARWLARACTIAGRDLTRDEWSRYLPNRPYEPTCSDLR